MITIKRLLIATLLTLPWYPTLALDSITVIADPSLSIIVSKVARGYTRDMGVNIITAYLPLPKQQQQITEGGAADVLITMQPEWIEELKTQGLIDIHSPTIVAKRYYAVVVAGENMNEARKFLAYLKSDEVLKIFRDNNL